MSPEPKQAEGKEEEEKEEVQIIGEDIITIYPRIAEPHRQVIITYRAKELPTRAITIDLFDLFKEAQEEAVKEIAKREGTLWERYKEHRAKRIKEDIERARVFKPERIIV